MAELNERRRRGGGGRAARHAKASEGPEESNLQRQGFTSGFYRPLTDSDLKQIHDSSLWILENVGVARSTETWRNVVLENGGFMKEERLCFPAAMVEDAIAKAGRNFTLYARDPKYDMEMSGRKAYFGAGSAYVQIQDLESYEYRESRLQDIYDNVRLADTIDSMHFIKRPGIAREIQDEEIFDHNTAYALLAGTSKHVITSFWTGKSLERAIEMFDLAAGGDGSGDTFRRRPFLAAICPFIVPPLNFAPDNCDVLETCLQHNIPAWLVAVGQVGATAPVTLAGALTQCNAEVLSGLTVLNLMKPGHPLIYGNWPLVCDLRTGAVTGSGGESALLPAASGQLSAFYDLPSVIITGATSSKVPDAQEGWEKGMLTTAAALSGANLVYCGAGNLADLIGGSLTTFMIDGEMMTGVMRCVRGIEVDETTLATDVVQDVATGAGHFLGHQQTIDSMNSEFFYPVLADRQSIDDWEAEGSENIETRAAKRVAEVLSSYRPNYIPAEVNDRIRKDFKIVVKIEQP